MNPDERRQVIEQRKQPTDMKARLWARDQWRNFDVWQVPVDALVLNIDNRRFAAERKLMEARLGHELDPQNSPDDALSVEAILLDVGLDVDGDRVVGKPGKDYAALKSDWERRQQESPLWIRPDGLVRNGNRRLAMLRRLQREGGTAGVNYVNVVILDPAEIDEPALFDMEQREQLTENLKVRYTDINLLLAVRDAATAAGVDWFDSESIEVVAGELQHIIGGNKAYAVVQLNAIRAMDAYLADSGQEGEYQKLIGLIERFRDVGKAMTKVEAGYPDDAADMMRLLFAAVRAGRPHGDIRALRRMFVEDRERFERLLAEVDDAEADWVNPEAGEQLADPDLAAADESVNEDDDDDQELPGPNVPNYPRDTVGDVFDVAIDGFAAAASLDALKTLHMVLNRLRVLTDDRRQLLVAIDSEHAEVVRAALGEVVAWADEQRPLLGEE